jgi:hypothetical protein
LAGRGSDAGRSHRRANGGGGGAARASEVAAFVVCGDEGEKEVRETLRAGLGRSASGFWSLEGGLPWVKKVRLLLPPQVLATSLTSVSQ